MKLNTVLHRLYTERINAFPTVGVQLKEYIMISYKIPSLPLIIDLETKTVLKKVSAANRKLAELKGIAKTIPNEEILINTLTLREAKDSSEVEGIITTHDDLYRAVIDKKFINNSKNTKEVINYRAALRNGFDLVREDGLLTNNRIKEIQNILEPNYPGFRKNKVSLIKETTGEVIYTPPTLLSEIEEHMSNLEQFINDDSISDLDYLVKMAIIHHQFESIHPFLDGNGRTGRMVNILYLLIKGLLDIPILYLSRYFIQNRENYYSLLKNVQESNAWESWILFVLNGIEDTAENTIVLVKNISCLIKEAKPKIRNILGMKYSHDLLNVIFSHPYTTVSFLQNNLKISRPTSVKYLNLLAEENVLVKGKIGKFHYYINKPLYDLLLEHT